MHGMMKKMPGPLAPPLRRRPNRNMTDLSYSWTTCNDSLGREGAAEAAAGDKGRQFSSENLAMAGVAFQMGIFGYCFLIASNFPFKAKDQRHLASTRKTNEVRLRFLSIAPRLSITMDIGSTLDDSAKTPIQSAEVNKKAANERANRFA